MKFVRQLPEKRKRSGSKFERLIGEENLEILRRSPSRWALVAEAQPNSSTGGFLAWARKQGDLQAATRSNAKQPGTSDYYLRFQPGGARP